MKVYKAVVLITLLYAGETWTDYQSLTKKLNLSHTTCLRKIMNVKWHDKIPDTEILAIADIPSILTILMHSQLCLPGHVCCMNFV